MAFEDTYSMYRPIPVSNQTGKGVWFFFFKNQMNFNRVT
jgi:hypothetical protein